MVDRITKPTQSVSSISSSEDESSEWSDSDDGIAIRASGGDVSSCYSHASTVPSVDEFTNEPDEFLHVETLVAELSSKQDRMIVNTEINWRVSHSHGQIGWHSRLARTICDRMPGKQLGPPLDAFLTYHFIDRKLADYVDRARRLGQDRMTYRRGSRLGVPYHAVLDDRRRGLIYWAISIVGGYCDHIAISVGDVLQELVLGLLAEERYEDRSLVMMPYY